MYTKQQIVKGFLAYLLQELANNGCQDIRKWMIPFAGEPFIMNMVDRYDDVLKSMNLMSENGEIDVDSVYNRLVKIAESSGPITQDLPVIGKMKFGTEDVMRIYNCIREVP